MANEIYIPLLNPVEFYEVDKELLPQYMSRHMDDVNFADQLTDYDTHVKYFQKWTTYDAIPFQYQSNFASIQMQIVDCNLNVILTQVATQVRANKFKEGYFVYQNTVSLANVPQGIYFLLMTLGGGSKKMISEPFIVNNDVKETMLFEYSNSRHHGDVIPTGIQFAFRVEARFDDYRPGVSKTMYQDQRLNPTMLNAIPFNTWQLIIGKDYGVPDWVARRMNWILSCDNVRIDGKPYAPTDDAELEPLDIDPVYPMRPLSIRVQEGYNRSSKIIGVEVDTTKKLLVGIAVDNTIFGDLSSQAGNNIINITDIE